jgi:hypothetical protein
MILKSLRTNIAAANLNAFLYIRLQYKSLSKIATAIYKPRHIGIVTYHSTLLTKNQIILQTKVVNFVTCMYGAVSVPNSVLRHTIHEP